MQGIVFIQSPDTCKRLLLVIRVYLLVTECSQHFAWQEKSIAQAISQSLFNLNTLQMSLIQP